MKAKRSLANRFKRAGAVCAILVAILLLMNAILNWRAGDRLEAHLERLRAEGSPTSLQDILRTNIADEENAALVLQSIKNELNNFLTEYYAFSETPLGKDFEKRAGLGEPPTAEQTDVIEEILKHHEAVFLQVRYAAGLPWYAALHDFSAGTNHLMEELIEEASLVRSAARLLFHHSLVAKARGDLNEATLIGIDILKLSRLCEQEPVIISYLVSVACQHIACRELNQIVRQDSLSKEMRDRIDAELSLLTGLNGYQEMLKTERVFGLEVISGWRNNVAGGLLGWPFTNWQSDAIEFYDNKALPMALLSWHVGHSQFDKSLKDENVLIQLIVPALEISYQAANRTIVTQRCLHILNELERYKATNGKEANGLADLSIPDAETIDPFSGNPLLLKATEKGWIVYSVFTNGKDDGGPDPEGEEQLDWGLTP